MNRDPTPREMGYYLALAQIGVEMVVPAALGAYADGWLGTTPWITLVAAALGFTAGLIHLILILKQKERDDAAPKKPPS